MKMIDSLGYGSVKASTLDILPAQDPGTSFSYGRWKWHYRALVRLRQRLLEHRAHLTAEVLECMQSFSVDVADAAADEFDSDLALGLIVAEQDTLFEIEDALSRIRAGTYGICEVTGQPIPAARLRAIPWTRFRQEVEERLEQQGLQRVPHLGEIGSVHKTGSPDRASELEDDGEEEDL
jgi:RNA polymerase-binding transcription factor DksA